jgi:alanine racemase
VIEMAEAFYGSQPSPGEIEERVKGYASWLEVDLDRLGFNLEQVRRRTGVEVIPCVKTNAYGHGLVPVVAYLMGRGVRRFLVAKLWEAMQLRAAGLGCGIINMDPLFTEGQFDAVVENGFIQTVFSRSSAEWVSGAAQRLGREAEVFVKVDTGLNRVGVRHEEAADLVQRVHSLPGLRVGGLFSTFVESPELDRVQLERMLAVDAELKRRGIEVPLRSMASSHDIFHFPESYLDAVRPGLMLYGVYPEPADRDAGLELRPVMTFKARLEHTKYIEEGESVTYSRRFIAPRRMRVGTVHAGYSDGYPRELMMKGSVRVGNVIKPVLGTISVNHHIVDLEGTNAEVGDVVELVSREGENTMERLCAIAGIEPYKFCVGLNPLTPRVYLERGRPVALSEPRLVEG